MSGQMKDVRAEAFRAVEAIGERYFTPEALEGCIKTFARHILDLTDELAKRDTTVAEAVKELDSEHGPAWASTQALEAGKEPIGCRICFPSDGSWPCITRMIADDLRALLREGA